MTFAERLFWLAVLLSVFATIVGVAVSFESDEPTNEVGK